jgi:hypothetical protein
MIEVKRWMFKCWVEGIIMERDSKGRVVAVEEGKCQEAEDVLNRGEIIGFLDNRGKCISTMSLVDGEYKEKLYAD